MDAKEARNIATLDIPGAFMRADMDEIVHVRLEGAMAELLVKDPQLYCKYIINAYGKPVLYLELLNAVYGMLQAALLFWRKLSATLIAWSFEINLCDWCIATKMIDRKQCTILWYVDDLKF